MKILKEALIKALPVLIVVLVLFTLRFMVDSGLFENIVCMEIKGESFYNIF